MDDRKRQRIASTKVASIRGEREPKRKSLGFCGKSEHFPTALTSCGKNLVGDQMQLRAFRPPDTDSTAGGEGAEHNNHENLQGMKLLERRQ